MTLSSNDNFFIRTHKGIDGLLLILCLTRTVLDIPLDIVCLLGAQDTTLVPIVLTLLNKTFQC